MKLNTLRTFESLGMLANANSNNNSNAFNANSNNNNSNSLNSSGPPAWILNLRDMDLDPPKLIRGNMEVIIWNKYKRQNDGTVESIRILDDAIWLKMMIPQVLMMTPQVFLVCLYCLVCLSGLVTNLSLIWVRNKMPRTSHKIVASIADKCQQQCQVILGKKVHRTPKNLYILNLGISGLSTRWGFLESIFSKKRF